MQVQFNEQYLVYAVGTAVAAMVGILVRWGYRRLKQLELSEVAKGWALAAGGVGLAGFGGVNVSENTLPDPPQFREGTPPQQIAIQTAAYEQKMTARSQDALVPMTAALPLLLLGVTGIVAGFVKVINEQTGGVELYRLMAKVNTLDDEADKMQAALAALQKKVNELLTPAPAVGMWGNTYTRESAPTPLPTDYNALQAEMIRAAGLPIRK